MAIKKGFKDTLSVREETINDNTNSTLEAREDDTPLIDSMLDEMQQEQEQKRPTTPKKHQEAKTKAKAKNNNAIKIDRPKRDIQVNTRISKEQYEKLFNDASAKNYKSVSDYIYYLITLDKN